MKLKSGLLFIGACILLSGCQNVFQEELSSKEKAYFTKKAEEYLDKRYEGRYQIKSVQNYVGQQLGEPSSVMAEVSFKEQKDMKFGIRMPNTKGEDKPFYWQEYSASSPEQLYDKYDNIFVRKQFTQALWEKTWMNELKKEAEKTFKSRFGASKVDDVELYMTYRTAYRPTGMMPYIELLDKPVVNSKVKKDDVILNVEIDLKNVSNEDVKKGSKLFKELTKKPLFYPLKEMGLEDEKQDKVVILFKKK